MKMNLNLIYLINTTIKADSFMLMFSIYCCVKYENATF